jgi:hypothetical protein
VIAGTRSLTAWLLAAVLGAKTKRGSGCSRPDFWEIAGQAHWPCREET